MITIYDVVNDFDNFVMGRSLLGDFFKDNFFTEITEYPYVNIYENDGTIEVAILAPGEKVEDINLQLNENRLIVEYDKKSDPGDYSYIMRERDFGKFRKSVNIPYKVDPNKINAGMKDGILTVKLELAEEAKPKKIQIQ